MWYMNEEREMLKNMAHDFAVSEIRPMVQKMDETGEFPHEIMRKIGEMGIIGLFLPEDCGGCGPRWQSRSESGNCPRPCRKSGRPGSSGHSPKLLSKSFSYPP